MKKKISIYANGLVHCCVCVPKEMTPEEIEQQANLENPTGINSEWIISPDKTFKTGEKNPSECEKDIRMVKPVPILLVLMEFVCQT